MKEIKPARASQLATGIVASLYLAMAVIFAVLSVHRNGAVGPALVAIGLVLLAMFYYVKNAVFKERLRAGEKAGPSSKVMLYLLWLFGSICLVIGASIIWTGRSLT